jgi:hypothetical protein
MLIFPPSMKDGDADRPVIIFKTISRGTENDSHIVFPIPQQIQFGDSAAYGNTELGFGGSLILTAGRSSSVTDALSNAGTQSSNSMPKDLRSLAGLLGSRVLSGESKAAVGIATGTTLNRNIVTEFTGVGTRQYGFQFKLVSASAQESKVIKEIVESFRFGLYPVGNSLQLLYPPTWTINFMKGGKQIEYLPKIFETYLQSMSTVYNSTTDLFHPDGSPVETDIQLSFVESRALTRDDIESLQKKPFDPSNRISNVTNAAAVREAAKTAEDRAEQILNP